MNIAIIGYGKMGREIEKIAHKNGHAISYKVTSQNACFLPSDLIDSDVAIEFSQPDSAIDNIYKCFEAKVPVIVGTTGWYNRFDEVKAKCNETNASLFYATNFSVGVNIFFALNRYLAKIMDRHKEYEVEMAETHHIHKLDAPSGTAITLAEGIIEELERKKEWTKEKQNSNEDIAISSFRKNEVPGTHSVKYHSEIDDIEITHAAKTREGFARGAVLAAEWMEGKTGIYTMKDMLNINY